MDVNCDPVGACGRLGGESSGGWKDTALASVILFKLHQLLTRLRCHDAPAHPGWLKSPVIQLALGLIAIK